MKTRGILYIVWEGYEARVEQALTRSLESVARWHPELETTVARLPKDSTLLHKAAMANLTPYDETMFLDADTVILGRLDYAYEKAAKHGLACCICECPWARRYPSCSGDQIEYNCGVLWFTRDAKPVFDQWNTLNQTIDSSIRFRTVAGVRRMGLNDQAGFTLAIEQTGFNPWVLPLNWNFRPLWHKTWFGPLKVWHDYSEVPREVVDLSIEQADPEAIIQLYEGAKS